jgi:RNase adaptor protein for sRNA GlmZ degradation
MDSEGRLFERGPPVRVVIMSYGGDFGPPPKSAICFVSVKNLPNPPASLRRHNGCNKDLRRFVVEGSEQRIAEIASLFRDAIREKVTIQRRELEKSVIVSFLCLKKLLLPETVAAHICGLLLCDLEMDDLLLCVGCVAGQHRSVSVVEHLKETKALLLKDCVWHMQVTTFHRELCPGTKTDKKRSIKRK